VTLNSSTAGPISVWKGRGDGTFVFPPVVTNGSFSGAATDVNGDGRADIVASDGTYAFGQADDTFAASTTKWWSPAGTPLAPVFCGMGAFHGPGSWNSAFAGNMYQGYLYVALGTVTPTGSGGGTAATLGFGVASHGSVACLGVGEFDGDGKTDLAIIPTSQGLTGPASTSLVVVHGNGDGTFQSTTTTIPNPYPAADRLSGSVMDVDGDGLSDVFILDTVSGGYQLLWNDGGGKFTPAGSSVPGPNYVGDVNGDGINDILSNDSKGQVYVVFGDGARGYGGRVNLNLNLPAAGPYGLDVNKDGEMDLIFPVQTTPGGPWTIVYVYLATAKTPAPASADIRCDASTLGSLCSPPARL
jgi:hypothetical protein